MNRPSTRDLYRLLVDLAARWPMGPGFLVVPEHEEPPIGTVSDSPPARVWFLGLGSIDSCQRARTAAAVLTSSTTQGVVLVDGDNRPSGPNAQLSTDQ